MLKATNFYPKNLLKTREDIFFNAKTKHYPSGLDKVSVSNKRVYRDKAYESRDYTKRNRPETYNTNGESRANNANAVRAHIFDIALCNKFTHFITLTFDPKKIDRYDDEEIKAKLKIWLKNAVARKELKYLLIPERHKDGAIHCHALVSGNEIKFGQYLIIPELKLMEDMNAYIKAVLKAKEKLKNIFAND